LDGLWPILFLLVVLKVPVAALLWLVWWAIRAVPEAEPSSDGGGLGSSHWRLRPRPPRGPRRGPLAPDALPLPACPPGGRTRLVRRPALPRVAAHGTPGHPRAPDDR
jgi:hypothetical protein